MLEASGGAFPDELVVTHLTPKRLPSLRALLAARRDGRRASSSGSSSPPPPPPPLCIFLSNPALRLFRESIGPAPGDAELLQGVTLRAARAGAARDGSSGSTATTASAAGGGRLRLLPAPTPRWPDLLLVFDTETRVLFTGKLFSAHVSPKVAAATSKGSEAAADGGDIGSGTGEDSGDSGGFDAYGEDWKHFYACMLSPVNAQATALLDRLDLRAAATGGGGGGGGGSGGGSVSGTSGVSLDEKTSNSPLASALRALEDALSDLQRSAFGAGAMGAGSDESSGGGGGLAVSAVAPMHGPVVAASLPQLLGSYRAWAADAARAASRASVAVFYASAYGNTAALAQAIARGATKAGVGAEAVNLEDAPLSEVEAALRRCAGFAIGSPTLGGHMPTQVTTALGALLRAPAAAREGKPCGAFGSFGWSGEAVDELERKLRDGGYRTAFPAVRVKFRPTAADMQRAEESGTDLAQEVLRRAAAREREAMRAAAASSSASSVAAAPSSPSSPSASAPSTPSAPSSSAELAAELAVGRVVGTLCVVTAGRVPPEEDGGGAGVEEEAGGRDATGGSVAAAASTSAASAASSAMLASWISQASFDPPGLTVAVKRDRAAEPFLVPGARFAVNVLAEGPGARAASKAMLRPFAPGEDRLAGWADAAAGAKVGEQSGAAILPSRLLASWLECEAVSRMEAGDHWVVYASVLSGGLGGEEEEEEGAKKKVGGKKGGGAGAANDVLSAVHHRKSGGTY